MKKQLLVLLITVFIGFGAIAQTKSSETNVLVLIYSQNGGTYKMAKAIAEGVQEYPNTKAILKRVPSINTKEKLNAEVEKLPVATIEELANYDGIAFGSPVHFANISADMNYFFSQSIPLWTSRTLEGKPATVFMSAGSGAGKEAAILSFWNILASHGMVIVPTGIMGTATLDKTVPQGNTPFGATSLAGSTGTRPSQSELNLAKEQGKALARVASGLKNTANIKGVKTTSIESKSDINKTLKDNNIVLPEAPKPVGNYVPFTISDHKVYINQVALKEGKILNPGKVGATVTEDQAKEATYQTMLNVIAVLKEACGGDLNKVKQCVQLTGYFNTTPEYTQHAGLMNSASNLTALVFGEKGKHARATIGAASLPINSVVEIQAIFEIE
ncbi:NAD(P)H:quinone oxidoreductase, type IV [Flavobacterium aquidurense]|jgi:NAD(P)H dehydrogenase (quinone)|uniref:NAD(P)H:quinone oxidoreductase n=1 Tax=Flavobacterium aquidurense TaxID=362413 RepID=UPI00091AFA37|nr:NAD(P)H:quinone oxidoreductase [Flavobacterium aquidurense]OXA70148.1 NAD(P)H:quinone oxidoreductase, type IV [Flavobacterium aquidurense]SHG15275.1 NAD(P)H dehydrogenase (quinone) [Flavobacterium frigidimaris]